MTFRQKITKDELSLILEKAREGMGYTDISRMLNNKITKQRVKQLCLKHNIDAHHIKTEKGLQEKAERMTAKWGVNWSNKEYRRSLIYQTMRQKFRAKRANATRIGKPWAIEFGELDFPTHCPVLGIELDYFAEKTQENSPSFDCLDPSKGYVSGNVVVISWRANRIKNDGTAQEHRAIASFIENALKPSAS
jgi:hypothetical protein